MYVSIFIIALSSFPPNLRDSVPIEGVWMNRRSREKRHPISRLLFTDCLKCDEIGKWEESQIELCHLSRRVHHSQLQEFIVFKGLQQKNERQSD